MVDYDEYWNVWIRPALGNGRRGWRVIRLRSDRLRLWEGQMLNIFEMKSSIVCSLLKVCRRF
jgi:hypothetical protein